MLTRSMLLIGAIIAASAPATAIAAEICSNGIDDDNNEMTDEGCYTAGVTGICESPASCTKSGAVGPKSGQLIYADDPDLDPRVPYGPGLTLRRTYVSTNSTTPTGYNGSLGYGWRHSFMSTISLDTAPSPDEAIVRTTESYDVLFTYDSNSGGYDYFEPQPGRHYDYLRKNTSTGVWQLRSLEGVTHTYDSGGLLTGITDGVGNTVTLAYSSGYLSTVTDASGERELRFTYASNKLDTVQLYVDGTLYATVDYTVSSNVLQTVKYGTTTMRTYSWLFGGSILSSIEDGDGKSIAVFEYNLLGDGKYSSIHTREGKVAYDYESCDGGAGDLVISYNYTDDVASACTSDSDCGTGNFCGGDISSLATCYRAQRCVAVSSPHEDVIDGVTASCPSCLTYKSFVWDTISGKLNLTSKVSATNLRTSYHHDAKGQVVTMVDNDNDGDATNGSSAGRSTYYFRSNSSYPGLVTEVRKKSELQSGTCSDSVTTACNRVITTYTAGGLVDTVQKKGFTHDASGSVVAYDFTTDYTYDGQGRLTQITGPRTDTSYDNVEFTYWSSADKLKDGYLKEVKRQTAASTYLVTTYGDYDHWGNPGSEVDANANLTCRTYETHRNLLTAERVTMNGQTSCSSHAADLVTQYEHDTNARLTKLTRPLGNCLHYAYDGWGRLSTLKERDDCNPASSGDTTEYTYSDDGQRIKTEHKDASSTVTFRNEVTYGDDRRLAEVINPDAPTKKKTYAYDADGKLASLIGEDGVGKTEWVYDVLRRTDLEKRYRDGSNSDDWDLSPGVNLDLPTAVTDEDGKAIHWVWDDLGRKVTQVSPEGGTHRFVYDESGNLVTFVEADGSADEKTHTYSYDPQNRLVAENTGDTDCFSLGGAEIQYSYDTGSSCPSGTCVNVAGRVSKVKTQVYCDNALSDDAFDQTTFYGYDDGGRLVKETVVDDGSRTAPQTYTWDKNSNLTQFVGPSGFGQFWNRGSAGSNSDADRVTTFQRDNTTTHDFLTNIKYLPSGLLKEYRHENKVNSNFVWARFAWDLGGRPSQIVWEEETSGTDLFKIDYTKDDQGRITIRDFTNGDSGLKDAYFAYDWLGRVTCDSKASGSCPTTAANTDAKTSMISSPPFTASGDRKEIIHRMGGWNPDKFTTHLISGTDKIDFVRKGTSGTNDVDMAWDTRGNRTYDDDLQYSDDRRDYTYDARNNLITTTGKLRITSTTADDYIATNAYDHKNRRFFRSFLDQDTSVETQWFYYYDPLDRLVEIVHTPDIASPSTYTIFQILWLEDRPVGYWQVNYPAGSSSRRYVHADEINRPLEVWSWATGMGSSTRVWALNPDLYGWDEILTGTSVYQPLSFPGQYRDWETISNHWNTSQYYQNRPALSDNRYRAYDSFAGEYLQVDPRVGQNSTAYEYAAGNPVALVDRDGLAANYVGRAPVGDIILMCSSGAAASNDFLDICGRLACDVKDACRGDYASPTSCSNAVDSFYGANCIVPTPDSGGMRIDTSWAGQRERYRDSYANEGDDTLLLPPTPDWTPPSVGNWGDEYCDPSSQNSVGN